MDKTRSYLIVLRLLFFNSSVCTSTQEHFLDKYLITSFVSFFPRKEDDV